MNFQPNDPCETPHSYVPQDTLTRWVGDDWKFPISYLTATGGKFNLTGYTVGADLYVRGSNTPISVFGPNGAVTIEGSPLLGSILAIVFSSVTALVKADPTFQDAGATRLQVWIKDANSLRTTIAVFPLFVRLE